ncbi:MAG: NAD(P)-binding protein [Deltaproteobacteria bacterium]|nr:NAD(P)-binding protein [Deltaproteobacteria bacterium]
MSERREDESLRVAVIGGGCAAMAAVAELSRPRPGRPAPQITVYQLGHRLGGKGASGRGASGRIEEHGLHLWMGYYENAFRLMRETYEELGRDPSRCPLARWSDAFSPANRNGVTDYSPGGGWRPWLVEFPPAPGLPGDGGAELYGVAGYLSRLGSLAVTLLRTLPAGAAATPKRRGGRSELFDDLPDDDALTASVGAAAARLLRYGAAVGLGALIEATELLAGALSVGGRLPEGPLHSLATGIAQTLRGALASRIANDDETRRLWEIVDLVLATIRGALRARLLLDPRGFDALDDLDAREWLAENGASRESLDSAFLRGLYDLAFAYAEGDPERPSIAAGAALRGSLRAFFTYRGAFFWRMNAGMGDVVFAPLYELCRRRGVKFEFFHKLTQIELGGSSSAQHVARLHLDVQARVRGGGQYEPLVDVGGLPCWPSEPDYAQLEGGARIRREGWDLESQWDDRRAVARVLEVGRDFDVVVLGVPLGVVPIVGAELLAASPKYQKMVDSVRSVATQALQLWLRPTTPELGWRHGHPVNVSGFEEPFDTWADMSHLVPREAWASPPGSIAYFCNALPEAGLPPSQLSSAEGARYVRGQRARVRAHAVEFLDRDLGELWPLAVSPSGGFRWELLQGAAADAGPDAIDGQFLTANVRPSDRYTQSLPGTGRNRISPLDRTFDNLTLAGDWTASGLDTGCVESAVMSGLLAAHSLTGSPRLEEIVGYDHP